MKDGMEGQKAAHGTYVPEHLKLALISFTNNNSMALLMELKLKAADTLKDSLLLKLFYNNSIPNII